MVVVVGVWGAGCGVLGRIGLSASPLPKALTPPPHPPTHAALWCCRMQAYASEFDDDIKDLQRADLAPRQRLAAQVRVGGRVGAWTWMGWVKSRARATTLLPGTSLP